MRFYLVTGGAGFIGSNLVEALLADGHRVRILDDFSTGRRENLEPFLDRIEVVTGTLAMLESCQMAVEGVDYVLHQGARPSVPKSIEFPIESNDANIVGTVNLLVAARDAGVKRVVFAASSSAYGNSETLPKIETMSPSPLSPYALQKFTGELYMKIFYETYGLETVSLRYFNIFGPRQDPTSDYSAVIPRFIMSLLKGEAPIIFGDGTQSRDFTYIDNVVQANIKAATAGRRSAGEVMNIACAERIDLNDLVRVINDILGSNIRPRYEPERRGDVKHSLADLGRAKELIGYEPKVNLADGIRRTVEWYKSNPNWW